MPEVFTADDFAASEFSAEDFAAFEPFSKEELKTASPIDRRGARRKKLIAEAAAGEEAAQRFSIPTTLEQLGLGLGAGGVAELKKQVGGLGAFGARSIEGGVAAEEALTADPRMAAILPTPGASLVGPVTEAIRFWTEKLGGLLGGGQAEPIASLAPATEEMMRRGVEESRRVEEMGEALGGGAVGQLARQFGATATGSLLPMAPAGIAGFAVGPAALLGISAATAGAQQAGATYAEIRDRLARQGVSDDQAHAAAAPFAAASGLITATVTRGFGNTGLEALANGLTRGGFFAAGKRAIREGAGPEMAEEYLDQLLQGIWEKIVANPDKSIADITVEAGVAGAMGGLLGGGVIAGKEAIGRIAETIARPVERRLQRPPRADVERPPISVSELPITPVEELSPESQASIAEAQRQAAMIPPTLEVPSAIPERKPAEVSVEVPPESRPQMGAQVREAEKPAAPQKAPVIPPTTDLESYQRALRQIGLSPEEYRRLSEIDEGAPMPAAFAGRVEIKPSGIEGSGAFSTRDFAIGELVAPGIVEGRRTELGRFINHSANPNVEARPIAGGVEFAATRPINAEDEITADYAQVERAKQEALAAPRTPRAPDVAAMPAAEPPAAERQVTSEQQPGAAGIKGGIPRARFVEDLYATPARGAKATELRNAGFVPAFRDNETGKVYLSKWQDGEPASIHIVDGLPDEVVLQRDEYNEPTEIKATLEAGFVKDGRYYTRDEAAAGQQSKVALPETRDEQVARVRKEVAETERVKAAEQVAKLPEPSATKEPWEMTFSEYKEALRERTGPKGQEDVTFLGLDDTSVGKAMEWHSERRRLLGKRTGKEILDDPWGHKVIIQKALLEGKPIPAEVLADYPDLQKAKALTTDIAQLRTIYPVIKTTALVDGRAIRHADKIPNMSSISSSIDDAEILRGIREVPMSDFTLTGKHYSVQGQNRIDSLAEQIKESGEITPLIVVRDSEGAYILEGATRADALFKLGAKSFPAKVVLDLGDLQKAKEPTVAKPETVGRAPELMTPDVWEMSHAEIAREEYTLIEASRARPLTRNEEIRLDELGTASQTVQWLTEVAQKAYGIETPPPKRSDLLKAVIASKREKKGYVREGDLYVYKPEVKAQEAIEKLSPLRTSVAQLSLIELERQRKPLTAEREQIRRILDEMDRRREGPGPYPSREAEDKLKARLGIIEAELLRLSKQAPIPVPGPSSRLDQIRKVLMASPSEMSGQKKAQEIKRLAQEAGKTVKDTQEEIEAEIVRLSHTIASSMEYSPFQKFGSLRGIYERQPVLSARTSTSVGAQAYSTPAPLAYALSYATGVDSQSDVYEPTAGNGMLMIGSNLAGSHGNELNPIRKDALQSLGVGTVTQNDATSFTPQRQFSVVLANPPFGTIPNVNYDGYGITKMEHLIALKAIEAMRPNGTAAIILGAAREAKETGKGAQWVFENYLYGHYNVVANFEVSGDLYGRQGAKWPVRVLVVSGRKTTPETGEFAPSTVARFDNWGDVWKEAQRIRNEIEQRKTVGAPGATGLFVPSAPAIPSPAEPRAIPSQPEQPAVQAREPIVHRRTPGTKPPFGRRPSVRVSGVAAQPVVEQPRIPESPPIQPGIGGQPTPRVEEPSGRNVVAAEDAGQRRAAIGRELGPGIVSKPLAVESTAFQSPYFPRSNGEPFGTLIPRNIAAGVESSLDALVAEVGPLDEYVANRLNMDVVELHQVLAAEQIDGAAMAIAQIEKGAASIVGDQTGIGKGRQAAAVIRYAILNGKIPIFFTKDPKLFTDMHGDLLDIHSQIKPLILGDPVKASIVDQEGEVIIRAPNNAAQKREIERVRASGLLESGYNAIFATYSQINQRNERQKFLEEIAEANPTIIVLDEAHEAAGDSETSMQAAFMSGGRVQRGSGAQRTITAVPGLLNAAGAKAGSGGVMYLSATYAKRPENMPVFFRTALSKAAQSFSQIVDAMKRGGVALQQAVSEALAKAGQYTRREREFKGVSYDMVKIQVENEEKLKQQVDQVTDVLGEIVRFSHDLRHRVKAAGARSTAMTQSQIDLTDFASVVHNQVGQLLLGAKADAVVALAQEAHRNGEKPVIALMNTMESFLSQYVAEKGIQEGSPIRLRWNELLKFALSRTLRITEKLPNGDTKIYTADPADYGLERFYAQIEGIADSVEAPFPISPIDYIIQRLNRSGVKMVELTGRESGIEYRDFETGEGIYRKFKKANKNRVVNGFNDGVYDGMLLNASGSTGLSAHASKKFRDQRPRAMFIAQPALDINVFVQTLGRIFRTGLVMLGKGADGQPYGARYAHLILPLQSELRPAAMAARKMKSLNANTTAEADAAIKIESEDFLNRYGDAIVAEYLDQNPELQRDLDLPIDVKDDGSLDVPRDVARRFTGRLALLPDEDQKNVYAAIIPSYRRLIDQLKATGEYDLEIVVHNDWDGVRESDEQLAAGTDESNIFTASVRLQQWEIADRRHTPTGDEMALEFRRNQGATSQVNAAQQLGELWRAFRVDANERLKRRSEVLNGKLTSAKDDIERDQIRASIAVHDSAVQRWTDTTEKFVHHIIYDAGQVVELRNNETGERFEGMMVDVKLPTGSRLSPSAFRFKFLLYTPGGVAHLTAADFLSHKWEKESSELTTDDLGAIKSGARYIRYFVTGNPIAGYIATGGRGKMVRFAARDGQTLTGLLMPNKWTPDKLANDPRLDLISGRAVQYLLENVNFGNKVEAGGIARIFKARRWGNDYTISTSAAKSTGGAIYLDSTLLRATGDFTKSGNRMEVTIDSSNLAQVAEIIMGITKSRFRPVDSSLKPIVEKANAARQSIGETGPAVRESKSELIGQAFYSRINRAVEQSPQNKATGAQWKAMIRNSKLVPQAEWDYRMLASPNALEDGKVYTKAELLEFLKVNEVQVKDATLDDTRELVGRIETLPNGRFLLDVPGLQRQYFYTLEEAQYQQRRTSNQVGPNQSPTRFSAFQLPGAKEGSYREVLLTVPREDRYVIDVHEGERVMNEPSFYVIRNLITGKESEPFGTMRAAKSFLDEMGRGTTQWNDGHSQYSEIANPIVRLRFNERTTSDGKRMLFLEEVQAPQKGEFEKMPALFQKNWREIAFKWALRHAAENGFDAMGWTTGAQQAERYDLSEQVDAITAKGWNGKWTITITDKSGNEVQPTAKTFTSEGELAEMVGKDLANKIVNEVQGYSNKTYTGLDLKVGGEGLKKLYDQDFRNVVNNLSAVKKSGQRVGTAEIGIGERRTFEGRAELANLEQLVASIRRDWELPTRTAEGWRRWNVTLNRQANDVMTAMRQGDTFNNAMLQHGSPDLSRELGGVWSHKPVKDTVHSIVITPEMRESIMGGQALFARGSTVQLPISEQTAIQAVNEQLGTATLPANIQFINDPSPESDKGTVTFQEGQLPQITINLAKHDSPDSVKDTLVHELLHPVQEDPELADAVRAVADLVSSVDTARKQELGYNADEVPIEATNELIRRFYAEHAASNIFQRAITSVIIAVKRLFGITLTARQAAVWLVRDAVKNHVARTTGMALSRAEQPPGAPPEEGETGTMARIFQRAISEEFTRPTQFAGATTMDEASRQLGGRFTAKELSDIGLPTIEFETENHSRMLTDEAWKPNEAAGQRLLERHVYLMDHAAELFPNDGERAGVLGTWINSLRNILGTMAERRDNGQLVTFSEALQNDLRGLVQGEARFWGQLLASLRGMSDSILWAVRNSDAILRTLRNEAYGGPAISRFMEILGEHFREAWTAEQVQRLVRDTRLATRLSGIGKIDEGRLIDLVHRTIQTPVRNIGELGGVFGKLLAQELGIPEMPAMAQKFNDALGERLKNALIRAREGAWKRMEKNLRKALSKRSPLWRRLERIIADGDLDFDEAIKHMAKREGWEIPTAEEIAKLKALAEREMALRRLSQAELDRINRLPQGQRQTATDAAQNELEAATDSERAELLKRMNVTWSRWTRPVSWKAYFAPLAGRPFPVEVIQNNAQAINEWITANLLARFSFFVRQTIDVGTQTLFHDPTRALGAAMLAHRDEIARGVFNAEFWRDAGNALTTAFDLRLKTTRHALAAARQGLKGRGIIKHSERISHRLDIFERMMQRAESLAAEGKTAQAFALRLVTWVRSGLLFSRAMDLLSTTGAKYVEIAHRIRTVMRTNGKSRAEVDQQLDLIFGNMTAQWVEAYARAQQIMDAYGIAADKAKLDEAAGNILLARAFTALKAIDGKSDDFQSVVEDMANTIGWNERETTGIGGFVGGILRTAQRRGEQIGIPTAFVSAFGNAIGIGINQKLIWMGLGKLAQFGGESPWYRTELDREQRLAQGFIGAGVSSFMAALVLAGAVAVRGFWPRDEKEREKWRIEGRRPGTIEIPTGDGNFITLSLSVGPLSLLAPALVAAGQIRQLIDERAEKQANLEADAARRGVPAGRIEPISTSDLVRVAGNALWASLVNARTMSGAVGAVTDQGIFEPRKMTASAISALTPPLPAWQDAMRVAGVYMNPRLATLGDMLVPMPTSGARRVNVLGDPSGSFDQLQQVLQTLTGGTYPFPINPKLAQKQPVYAALFHSNYVPAPPVQGKGYVIDGTYRPMTRNELQNYTELRGQEFAKELAIVAPNAMALPQSQARKIVEKAFQKGNENALRRMGVDVQASRVRAVGKIAMPETAPARVSIGQMMPSLSAAMTPTLPRPSGGLSIRFRTPRRRTRLTRRTRVPRLRITRRPIRLPLRSKRFGARRRRLRFAAVNI